MSDWSTDSCGWSDEDYGVDLDFTTPPLSVDSGAVESSDQEIVRCICEVEEENDFMIQVSCGSPADSSFGSFPLRKNPGILAFLMVHIAEPS